MSECLNVQDDDGREKKYPFSWDNVCVTHPHPPIYIFPPTAIIINLHQQSTAVLWYSGLLAVC